MINQTFKDIEIILVDDGSPDRCPQICDEYMEKDTRITVIHKENGGLSDARNGGIKYANGEYIIFVDFDEYIEEDMCDELSSARNDIDSLTVDAFVEGGKTETEHIDSSDVVYSSEEYLVKALSEGKFPMEAWLNVYKRDFLAKNNLTFKFGILNEDIQFTPRTFLCADNVVVTGIQVYHYAIREGSISTNQYKRKSAKDYYDSCNELSHLCSTITNNKLQKMLMDILASQMLFISQRGRLYQYGSEYIYKDFIRRHSCSRRNKTEERIILL